MSASLRLSGRSAHAPAGMDDLADCRRDSQPLLGGLAGEPAGRLRLLTHPGPSRPIRSFFRPAAINLSWAGRKESAASDPGMGHAAASARSRFPCGPDACVPYCRAAGPLVLGEALKEEKWISVMSAARPSSPAGEHLVVLSAPATASARGPRKWRRYAGPERHRQRAALREQQLARPKEDGSEGGGGLFDHERPVGSREASGQHLTVPWQSTRNSAAD